MDISGFQNLTNEEKNQIKNDLAKWRIKTIDRIINALPDDERREENPIKTCANCYNLGKTCLTLGLFRTRRRCKDCVDGEKYSLWSSVHKLRKEFMNDF